MNTTQHYTIDDIESMKETTAAAVAEELITYKGYNVYFVNFNNSIIDGASYFGYSAIVFKNGRQIKYANDYQLHHITGEYNAKHEWITHTPTKKELKEIYMKKLTGSDNREHDGALFSPADMCAPINSYREFERRLHWLNNYYPLECETVSICYIGKPDSEQLENLKRCIYRTENWSIQQYANKEDVALYDKMYRALFTEYDKYINSLEGFRAAVADELANHEACITCDYSEALSALGYSFKKLDEKKKAIVLEELNKQIKQYNC